MLSVVTAAAAPPPSPLEGVPFASASPAEVRAALTVEDAAVFDAQWRAAMATATETLDLAAVHALLEAWRPVAWLTAAHGADGYRRILARADQVLRTGERPAGTVSLEATRLAIAEQLA
jgi:hypothetical protein